MSFSLLWYMQPLLFLQIVLADKTPASNSSASPCLPFQRCYPPPHPLSQGLRTPLLRIMQSCSTPSTLYSVWQLVDTYTSLWTEWMHEDVFQICTVPGGLAWKGWRHHRGYSPLSLQCIPSLFEPLPPRPHLSGLFCQHWTTDTCCSCHSSLCIEALSPFS